MVQLITEELLLKWQLGVVSSFSLYIRMISFTTAITGLLSSYYKPLLIV